MDEKREKLKDFYFSIRDCRDCALWKTKTKLVFGSGNANAKLVFIGEAPGKNEDLQGKPFVGRAGQVLDNLLASIDLTRDQVFIANVLKCRPPQNRDPRPLEVGACKGHLLRQVEIIDPTIICTLGKHSTQLIIGTSQGITKLRGKVFNQDGRMVIPINHPAAVLYHPAKYHVLEKDFQKIKKLLDQKDHRRQEPVKPVSPPQKPEQLGLF